MQIQEVDAVHIQMAFLFSILWGLCCTMTSASRQQFDPFFRNLVDGLIKGHVKPISFRYRSNIMQTIDKGTCSMQLMVYLDLAAPI